MNPKGEKEMCENQEMRDISIEIKRVLDVDRIAMDNQIVTKTGINVQIEVLQDIKNPIDRGRILRNVIDRLNEIINNG